MKQNPSNIILKALEYLMPGSVLDIGPGIGKNSIYLSAKGFKVTALDINQELLNNLPPDMEKIKGDISNFDYERKYNNIICNFVLHFLPKDKFLPAIEGIQNHTEIGGINVISDFMAEGQLKVDQTRWHWLGSKELKEIYKDWEVLYYEESVTFTKVLDDEGYSKYHHAAYIIAKKSK